MGNNSGLRHIRGVDVAILVLTATLTCAFNKVVELYLLFSKESRLVDGVGVEGQRLRPLQLVQVSSAAFIVWQLSRVITSTIITFTEIVRLAIKYVLDRLRVSVSFRTQELRVQGYATPELKDCNVMMMDIIRCDWFAAKRFTLSQRTVSVGQRFPAQKST